MSLKRIIIKKTFLIFSDTCEKTDVILTTLIISLPRADDYEK